MILLSVNLPPSVSIVRSSQEPCPRPNTPGHLPKIKTRSIKLSKRYIRTSRPHHCDLVSIFPMQRVRRPHVVHVTGNNRSNLTQQRWTQQSYLILIILTTPDPVKAYDGVTRPAHSRSALPKSRVRCGRKCPEAGCVHFRPPWYALRGQPRFRTAAPASRISPLKILVVSHLHFADRYCPRFSARSVNALCITADIRFWRAHERSPPIPCPSKLCPARM